MPVVGLVRAGSAEDEEYLVAFRKGLGETGYIEGQNVKGPFNRQFRLASWGSLLHRPPTYLLRKTPDFAGALGGESDDAPDSCPANFSQHTGLSHVQPAQPPARGALCSLELGKSPQHGQRQL
jgi:hypothetical protein